MKINGNLYFTRLAIAICSGATLLYLLYKWKTPKGKKTKLSTRKPGLKADRTRFTINVAKNQGVNGAHTTTTSLQTFIKYVHKHQRSLETPKNNYTRRKSIIRNISLMKKNGKSLASRRLSTSSNYVSSAEDTPASSIRSFSMTESYYSTMRPNPLSFSSYINSTLVTRFGRSNMGGQLHNSALPSEPPPEYHLFDEETVDREEEEEVTSYSLIYPNHPDETSEMFSSIISVRSIELSESVGNVLSFQTASLVLSSDDGSSTLDEPFDTKLSSTMLF